MVKYPVHLDPRKQPDWPKKSDYSTAEWLNRVTYIWAQWNSARQRAELPRVDPPDRLGIAVTHRPPLQRGHPEANRPTNESISFSEWRARNAGDRGPLIDGFNRQRQQQDARNDHLLNTVVASDITPEEEMEISAAIGEFIPNGGSISPSDFDDAGGAGPSNGTMDNRSRSHSQAGRQNKRQRVNAPEAQAAATASDGGTGHNSQSDGGFDSSQGPISTLPKGGYTSGPGYISMTKVHRQKHRALPYYPVAASGIRDGAWMITTPLSKVYWEYMFYYMSKEEFDLIPAGSYVESVSIKVMQSVATTIFETNASTSTFSTTNNPKVLVIGHDLEKKCMGGIDRKVIVNEKMIPTAISSPDVSDFIKKQYGTDQTAATITDMVIPGCAHGIPYYNPVQFCIYQPNYAQAKALGMYKVDATDPSIITENNAPGFEYFNNMITSINSNDTTWDEIATLDYKFVSAPIGEQFPHLEIPSTNISQNVGNADYYNMTRTISNSTIGADLTFTESIAPTKRSTVPIVTYDSAPIEKGSIFVKGDGNFKPARQPTFHCGMRAVDKANLTGSATRATDFALAYIEFDIVATINIRTNNYPYRHTKPKYHYTSLENAVTGAGAYPAAGPADSNQTVAFGLYGTKATAPTASAVDVPDPTTGRVRRSLRHIGKDIRVKTKKR
nr:VP1 [Mute swan feces associated ambidensovirus 4]